ncbi:MAG: hypothetical protein P4L40_16950 [Terracidiphilus sp.]|nr:hypothetical protein [Terracidiphilus sp.]
MCVPLCLCVYVRVLVCRSAADAVVLISPLLQVSCFNNKPCPGLLLPSPTPPPPPPNSSCGCGTSNIFKALPFTTYNGSCILNPQGDLWAFSVRRLCVCGGGWGALCVCVCGEHYVCPSGFWFLAHGCGVCVCVCVVCV